MRKNNKIILSSPYIVPVLSRPVKNGSILIEGKYIKDIGPSQIIEKKYPGIPKRCFKNTVMMPGFVNAHVHLEYSALGPLKKQTSFIPWIRNLIAGQRMLAESEILNSIKETVKGLISSGITSVGEVSRSGLSMEELKKSGLRGIYYTEFVAVDDKSLKKASRDLERNFRKAKKELKGTNLKAGVFPHSVYTLSTKSLKYVSAFCGNNEARCGIHAAELDCEARFVYEGAGLLSDFVNSFNLESIPEKGKWKDTFEYLKSLKFINPAAQLVHCVHIGKKAFPYLEKSKTGVVLCPRSNYMLKNGKFPLNDALKYDLNMGIGTDSLASNMSLDMFEEMRRLKRNRNPRLTDEKLIEMATLGGAKALGLENETGNLTPGKKADIIAVKTNRVSGKFSPVNYLVTGAKSKDVCFTMIDGVVKYYKA